MTIAVPLNLNNALAPSREINDSNVFVGDQGLFIEDNAAYAYAGSLGYTGIDTRVDGAIADSAGGAPATIASAALGGIYLPAGASLTFKFDYVPGDLTKNEVALVILEGSSNNETIDLIANSALVNADNGAFSFTNTLPVSLTDTYQIVLVVGDAAGASYPSSLQVTSITENLPASSAFGGNGLSLGGGYSITTDGALEQNGVILQPNYASAAGSGNLATIAELKQSGAAVVSNDGSTLIGAGGSSLLSQDGGGLISNDGGGLISNDGGGLISNDGGGLLSQDGGGLISQDGGGLISQDGGGLISQDGGGFKPEAPRQYTLASVTLPPGASATSPPTFTAGADATLTSQGGAFVLAYTPKVATLSNGKYVVVWADDSGANGSTETVGQVYNADGTTYGAQFVANMGAYQPTVAALSDGRFVVGGTQSGPAATGYLSSVHAQVFGADGAAQGGVIAISPPVDTDQSLPSFAPLASGGFVAVWSGIVKNASAIAPAAQIFDASGAPVGPAVQIPLPARLGANAYYQSPAAAPLSNGGFAVAFSALAQSGGLSFIVLDLFDKTGAATATVQVSAAGAGGQAEPALATLANGNIVVAWLDETSVTNTQPIANLLLQIVDPAGALVGSAVIVAPVGVTGPPSITALSSGGFAVGWNADTYSGGNFSSPSSADVRVQLFNADGSAAGLPLFADDPNSYAMSPSLATLPNQSVLVATSQLDVSIHAKTFTVSAPPSSVSPDVGVGVDGYISGATVFADAKGTGVLTPGDVATTTDAKGKFTLPANAAGPLVLTGGIDTSTGLPFTQTYSAPAGSRSITALSTLVQKRMAAGVDLGTANAQVAAALGLSSLTDLTSLDPVASVAGNQFRGLTTLLADAVVADTLRLAQAAGASGDLFGKLAGQIGAHAFQAIDPTSVATLQALGLSGQVATDTAALASASSSTLIKALIADKSAVSKLTADVAGAETVAQGPAASALRQAVAAGGAGSIVPLFSGANLAATVAATVQTQAGAPPDIDYTDVTAETVGYASATAYSGPVPGLQHQYIWGSSDPVAVASHLPNVFLKGGPGGDALLVTGGSNVLDGGAGSNFLVGSAGGDGGHDTFFVDGRGGEVTWSTFVNFRPGDTATLFGFHDGLSTMPLTGSEGAAGYTGLTLHSELAGAGSGITASMTFAGIDRATSDAHFTYATGTLGAGTPSATDYLVIRYDR